MTRGLLLHDENPTPKDLKGDFIKIYFNKKKLNKPNFRESDKKTALHIYSAINYRIKGDV